MKQLCEHCTKEYDDLDHMTYCPHPWFPDWKEEPFATLYRKIVDAPPEALDELLEELQVQRAWAAAVAEERTGVTAPPE